MKRSIFLIYLVSAFLVLSGFAYPHTLIEIGQNVVPVIENKTLRPKLMPNDPEYNRQLFEEHLKTSEIVPAGGYEAAYTPSGTWGYFTPDGKWQEDIQYNTMNVLPYKDGIVSALIGDFNKDGTEEMIAVSVVTDNNNGIYDISTIFLELYTVRYGELKVERRQLSHYIMGNETHDIDVFLFKSGDRYKIAFEGFQHYNFSDNYSYLLEVYDFESYYLEQSTFLSVRYDEFDNNEIVQKANETIQGLGLKGTFFNDRLMAVNQNAIPLLNIKSYPSYNNEKEYNDAIFSPLGSIPKPQPIVINDYSEIEKLLNTDKRSGLVYDPKNVNPPKSLTEQDKYIQSLRKAILMDQSYMSLGTGAEFHVWDYQRDYYTAGQLEAFKAEKSAQPFSEQYRHFLTTQAELDALNTMQVQWETEFNKIAELLTKKSPEKAKAEIETSRKRLFLGRFGTGEIELKDNKYTIKNNDLLRYMLVTTLRDETLRLTALYFAK